MGKNPSSSLGTWQKKWKSRPCDKSCVKVVPLNVQHTHWLNPAPEEFNYHIHVFESNRFAIRVCSMDNVDSLCRKRWPGDDLKNEETSSEILGCVIRCLVPDISTDHSAFIFLFMNKYKNSYAAWHRRWGQYNPSKHLEIPNSTALHPRTRRSAVCWGTALQVGRSRVRFPMVSPEIFSRTMALGSTQPLTEMSTRNTSGG